MDQEKIGRFIANCRKEKDYTQAELAEKLNITDRAVSKWETGKGMPDISIMLDLCSLLDINVNELLSGQKINMEDYQKQAETNLIELKKKEEDANKKILHLYRLISIIFFFLFLVLVFISVIFIESEKSMIGNSIMIISLVVLLIFSRYALQIEQTTGYYECAKCHHKYIPSYKAVVLAPHIGTTRYLKCPHCQKHSWNKKAMTN